MAGKSRFLEQIARAKAATQPARPEEKPLEEMTSTELDEQLRLARVEAIEANKALAQALAAEHNRPPSTLAAVLADLKRSRRRNRR